MNDEQILLGLRNREEDSLEALIDRYAAYVSAIVWNILRAHMPKQDAEEVVSDVFLAAWNQAQELQAPYIKAWLGAVARNKAKNKLRRVGAALPLEEDVLELPGEDTPASLAEQQEERILVRQAVDSMEEPDREVFLRHYYFAQSVKEISKAMRLKEPTVKTKLRRGRLKLKQMLMRWDVR